MDAEKVTEVEMKDLTPEVQDVDKGKVEETKEAEKGAEHEEEAKKEKEVKEEESQPKSSTENISSPSVPSSSKSNEEAEKKAEEDKKEGKEDLYCKLNNPSDDVYNIAVQSSSKSSEAEKKAEDKKEEKKEKEGKEDLYCKLNNPSDDVYNIVVQSSSKSSEEAEKKAEKEGEGNVYCKLKRPSEDIYSLSIPSSSSKGDRAEKVGKKEEENEDVEDVYSKLNDPSENVYMTAMSSSSAKQNKELYRSVLLYKRISAVFIVLSLLLLAVVLALAMKLNGNSPEITELKSNCEPCQSTCSAPMAIQGRCYCSACEEDWEKFEDSCYFFSEDRLSWQESRKECQKQGGDLAVIHNERVQEFLNKNGYGVWYWIGLRYSEEQRWMWLNSTAPTRSFWSSGHPNPDSQGSCAALQGESNLDNWLSFRCDMHTQYICQRC